MQPLQKRNPAGGPGSSSILASGLPKNPSEVAARLQRRLCAFSLVVGTVCRDLESVQQMVSTLAAGFGLTDDERRELSAIAVRLKHPR